ncbi:hypothetical protein Peur_013322 [Populus x canadensis]
MKCPYCNPLSLRSSFPGHLAELERRIELNASTPASSSNVVVDNLRASVQIIDVASILGSDCDVSGHAFHLFKDCCSATVLLVWEMEVSKFVAAPVISSRSSSTWIKDGFLLQLQEFKHEEYKCRWLEEISIAGNAPQKEIGKCIIKILGEALQLSQPINNNSISVHMP